MTLEFLDVIFVMTSHLEKHWDGVESSYYYENWIKFNPSILDVGVELDTVFIKVSKPGYEIEKVWIGKSKITSIIRGRYEFEVKLDDEIPLEIFLEEFSSNIDDIKLPGWYLRTRL